MAASPAPQIRYNRAGTNNAARGHAAPKGSNLVPGAPVLPAFDRSVKPKVSAKARWADLQSRVTQRSTVRVRLRRQQLAQTDVWARMTQNEKTRAQLDAMGGSSSDDDDSDLDPDDEPQAGGGGGPGRRRRKRRGGIKVWCHIHDGSYPEQLSDHVTRFACNPPRQTFLFPLGKGKQDFRWLSLGCMRRFTSVYRPRGRVRHREWYVGPGDINIRANTVFLNKDRGGGGGRGGDGEGGAEGGDNVDISTAQRHANEVLAKALAARKATAEAAGYEGKKDALADAMSPRTRARRRQSAAMRSVMENTMLRDVLQDGDHVWIQFQNGSPRALLAGGKATEMTSVDMFRRTRLHNGMLIAPKPKTVKKKKAKPKKEEFKLEKSVFANRATLSDSGSFYDTKEYYDRVCRADLEYCGRLVDLVGGKAEYNRIVDLLCEHYKCVREAFRFHVAQSRAGTFEMSWLDFSAFSKYCKLIDSTGGEHTFNYHDLDTVWVTVNCHTQNEKVDSHHIRFLSRFEFLESLVRIALKKYATPGEGKGSPPYVGCYAAVEHLLSAHIVPYFKHMDANVFRRVKLYSPSTATVFERFKPSLKLAFRQFAVTSKAGRQHGRLGGQAVTSRAPLTLTRDEWADMLEAAGMAYENGLTRKAAHGIFVFSQASVLDEYKRSRKDSMRDDHKTMSFEEAMEGFARAADVWGTANVPPEDTEGGSEPFEQKLTRFLMAFCQGLKL